MRVWSFLMFLFIGFIVIELFYFTYLLPKTSIDEISIEGDLPVSNEQLFEIFGWQKKPLYWQVNTYQLTEKLRQFINEKDIQMIKKWPNELIIRTKNLGYLVIVYLENKPYAVGTSGIAVPLEENWQSHLSLPVITGISFTSSQLGWKMEKTPSFFRNLIELKRQYPQIYQNLNKIEESQNELFLYWKNGPFVLHLLSGVTLEKLVSSYISMEWISKTNFNESYLLDMRGQEIVYKKSGEST